MNKTKEISVCLSPTFFESYTVTDGIVVVVDILRATSVISTAFHFGIKEIIPVLDLENTKQYINKQEFIIAAEENSLLVKGVDYGNSPFQYMNENVKDKTLVLTTTNGTKVLNLVKEFWTITASFVNFDAVRKYLLSQEKNILFLCAGWKGFFNLEDTIFVGKLSKVLMDSGFTTFDDSTLAAIELYKASSKDLFGFLQNSSYQKRNQNSLDIKKDIEFCLSPTFHSNVVPKFSNGKLIM